MNVNYWLLKSEPSTWSWEDQVKADNRNVGWCKKLSSKK